MSASGASGSKRPPNIIFFFTDDQRFDTIAALGNRQAVMPAMDSLVASGTAFTHAHIMGGSVTAGADVRFLGRGPRPHRPPGSGLPAQGAVPAGRDGDAGQPRPARLR